MSMLHILASASDAALQTSEQRALACELASVILKKGDIQVNTADYKGLFPLDHAVANEEEDGGAMVELLRGYGATMSKHTASRSPPPKDDPTDFRKTKTKKSKSGQPKSDRSPKARRNPDKKRDKPRKKHEDAGSKRKQRSRVRPQEV